MPSIELPFRLHPHWLLCVFVSLAFVTTAPALEYPDNKSLEQQIKKIERAHKKLVRLESVAATRGKNDLWLVELGAGKDAARKLRPALLLVAGIEGNDLAGTVSVLAWAERLADGYEKDDAIRKLLDTTTVYIFPRVNPDATGRFFAKPKTESLVNNLPVDDDHDGLVDEDGPEDLNGDGLITWMRVEDREGEFILDPVEPRLLAKADRAKGEAGAWRLFTEGIDNDKDEAWNEDGPGGVNFNRNFPFNYRFFAPWAGANQVSEPETRALAEFVVAHPNIGIVFTFGAADNLAQPPKAEAPKRPPTAVTEDDLPFYRELGKAWRDTLGVKKELTGSAEPGTFSDWMYFHRGRLSLAAHAWSPALQLELAKGKPKAGDEQPKEEKPKDDKPADTKKDGEKKKGEEDKRNEEDRAFLKWADESAPELFVPWKEFKHPDFPGKKVEIGGFAPFAKSNPPEKLLADLADKHGKFLTALAGRLPRAGLRKSVVKPLGESVYDVTLQIENTGYLPTSLSQGNLTREVHQTRVVLKVDAKNILSGARITMLGPIEGSGGMKEARYILRAKDQQKIAVEIISMLGGTVQASVDLKEEK